MKKRNSLIAAGLTAVLLSGTAAVPAYAEAQETKAEIPSVRVYTGIYYESKWSEEAKRNLVESECPQIVPDEETAAAYPALAEAFARLNEEKKKAFGETCQELVKEAEERLREDPEYPTAFTDRESWNVVRADSHIVSLLGTFSGYTGGAHGYEGYSGISFDPETGEALTLGDLVTDGAAFQKLAEEEVRRLYPDIDEELTERYFKETAPDDMIWTAGYDGITCYFNAYTLGPYAIGPQVICIPYAGNEGILSETAADVPENYGMEFPMGYSVRIGGHELAVFGKNTEYDSFEGISICVDGESTDFDEGIFAYSVHPTYFMADGKEYLYLEYGGDDDSRSFDIYRLGEKPERVGTEDLASACLYAEAESFTGRAAMTDPEHLLLSRRSWILGTNDLQRAYRVGSDGKPEPAEEYFRYTSGRILTAKEEIACSEADAGGNVIGTIRIPAGAKVTLFRTDDKKLVDMCLEDGRIARVEVSGDNWPQTIDGKDVRDLFDGILFAG